MKLVPYDINKLNRLRNYSTSENLDTLNRFVESDITCARVEHWTHCSATSCMSSISKTIKTYHMDGVKCVVRKGEVYLVKTNL